MPSNVINFPHDRKHLIQSLLRTAQLFEDTSPSQCVGVQKEIISMLALECKRSTIAANAAKAALESLLDSSQV